MDRGLVMRVYRLGFALLTIVAIVAVAADLQSRGRFDPLDFFSYFTIQSNLIATAVFVVGAAGGRSAPSPGWQLLRGQVALVMTVTLVVFAVFSVTFLGETLRWNFLAAGACLVAAVVFIFLPVE